MFDELKEVKYFEEITYFKSFKNKTLEETSSKSRGVLKPKRAPVMELSYIYLTAYFFRNKISIIDFQTGLYIYLQKY